MIAKVAASFPWMSPGFFLTYVGELAVLAIYALLWQQIIKKFSLSVAYANRSTAALWALTWSALIFREAITIRNIIGIFVIVMGVYLVNSEGRGERHV